MAEEGGGLLDFGKARAGGGNGHHGIVVYMVLHGYTWFYMVTHGYTWLHMVLHGCTGLFMVLPVFCCTWEH